MKKIKEWYHRMLTSRVSIEIFFNWVWLAIAIMAIMGVSFELCPHLKELAGDSK